MEIKEYYKGCRVHFNGEPESTGEIVETSAFRARVSWDNGNTTWEMIRDLEPNLTPKQMAGKLIAHWNVKENGKDLAAVRSIVESAIDGCGLDATATVEVDTEHDIPTLGHFPYKAVIKINNAYPAVRMRNGTIVKGMDTITVHFARKVGLVDFEENGERQKAEARFENKHHFFLLSSQNWHSHCLIYRWSRRGFPSDRIIMFTLILKVILRRT